MFPNEHYVYLHDTPKPYLFKHGDRAFSSGCVRVADPSKLAQFLMDTQRVRKNGKVQMSLNADGQTSPAAVNYENLLATGENQQVVLAESLPVYLVYFTAWVDLQGRLQFRDDIYNRDKKVAEQLTLVDRSVFRKSRLNWADTEKMFAEPPRPVAKKTEQNENDNPAATATTAAPLGAEPPPGRGLNSARNSERNAEPAVQPNPANSPANGFPRLPDSVPERQPEPQPNSAPNAMPEKSPNPRNSGSTQSL